MEIKRGKYLDILIRKMNNDMVKVITGIRRSGKTYLLFNLFYDYLLSTGIKEHQIIKISLDGFENKKLRNMNELNKHINSLMSNPKLRYFIFIDEVQNISSEKLPSGEILTFHFLLMDLMKKADVYVTGSNSKMLSSEIITEFRGRGEEIRVHPLSFNEYLSIKDKNEKDAWKEYKRFGGLPRVVLLNNDEDKKNYLTEIFNLVYIKDIIDRNNIRHDSSIIDLVINILATSVGSLTNPLKLSNTFQSKTKNNISWKSIKKYLDLSIDSFLIDEAKKYNIKGRALINGPVKYYFEDIGLRNARIGFDNEDDGHKIENILFNELKMRGFKINVGVVETYSKDENNKQIRINNEIDFVAQKWDKKFYIQCAKGIYSDEIYKREIKGLKSLNDSFKKIIVVEDDVIPGYTEEGIFVINIIDFLKDEKYLE